MKKKIIVVKTFKVKGLGKWFGCFWFFNHSLKWFLVAPPKDWFAQYHNQQPCGQGDFNMTRQTKQTTILHNMMVSIDFSQCCLHHFFFFFTLLLFKKKHESVWSKSVILVLLLFFCFAWLFDNLFAFQHDFHYFRKTSKKFIK